MTRGAAWAVERIAGAAGVLFGDRVVSRATAARAVARERVRRVSDVAHVEFQLGGDVRCAQANRADEVAYRRRLVREYEQALAAEQERTRRAQAAYGALLDDRERSSCDKVRCGDRDEALVMAESFSRRLGVAASTFKAYECRVCPKRVNGQRWWHIANRTPSKRTKAREARERAGSTVVHTTTSAS